MGTAMAARVAIRLRRVMGVEAPVASTSFRSCSSRIACSANSSVTPGPRDSCMVPVTLESVVGPLHASQAAPAVALSAKTLSRSGSMRILEPSGSLFSTKAFKLMRFICTLTSYISAESSTRNRPNPTYHEQYTRLRD